MISSIHRSLKRKTQHVVSTLESSLGVPIPPKRRAPPLDMLIATVLSQNTNDQNSHRAYLQLKEIFPTWRKAATASRGRIATAIRTGGMANQKSISIKSILRTISKKYGGYSLNFLKKKSDDEIIEMLVSFDGVGLKTASCVLLFSLGRDVFPVDTHVHRICGRLGLAPDRRTPQATFYWMKTLVPKGKSYSFHTNLIRFGRRVCRANRPLCGICPLFSECDFVGKEKMYLLSIREDGKRDPDFMLLDHV